MEYFQDEIPLSQSYYLQNQNQLYTGDYQYYTEEDYTFIEYKVDQGGVSYRADEELQFLQPQEYLYLLQNDSHVSYNCENAIDDDEDQGEDSESQYRRRRVVYDWNMQCSGCKNKYDMFRNNEILSKYEIQKLEAALRRLPYISQDTEIDYQEDQIRRTYHPQFSSLAGNKSTFRRSHKQQARKPEINNNQLKRLPWVLLCGHTVCSVCYCNQRASSYVFKCNECKSNIPGQFQTRPIINSSLYKLYSEMMVIDDEIRWRHCHKYKPMPREKRLYIKNKNACFREGCRNPKFVRKSRERELFCSMKCKRDYQYVAAIQDREIRDQEDDQDLKRRIRMSERYVYY